MQIDIRSNIKELTKELTKIQKEQIPFATSKTLNEIAYRAAKQELPKKPDEVFAGGAVNFTKTGFNYKKSTKRNLIASVFINPTRAKYMQFMVQGGARFPDKRAILVSTKHSKLTKQGNLPRHYVRTILSDKQKYFSGIPKGKGNDQDYAGIWERYGRYISSNKKSTDYQSQGRRIRMVAHYASKGLYKPLFPFGAFTEGIVFSRNDGIAIVFRRNLKMALENA